MNFVKHFGGNFHRSLIASRVQSRFVCQRTNKEIANLFNIQYQTSLLIFKGSKEVYRSIGETTEDLIYEAIKTSI